jgi:hypothetical protein
VHAHSKQDELKKIIAKQNVDHEEDQLAIVFLNEVLMLPEDIKALQQQCNDQIEWRQTLGTAFSRYKTMLKESNAEVRMPSL